jgi:hypothetical protein
LSLWRRARSSGRRRGIAELLATPPLPARVGVRIGTMPEAPGANVDRISGLAGGRLAVEVIG